MVEKVAQPIMQVNQLSEVGLEKNQPSTSLQPENQVSMSISQKSSKAYLRRFKTETVIQKNLLSIDTSKVSSKEKTVVLPDPISIAVMVLFLARVEVILHSIDDAQIQPLKTAIIEHKHSILYLQGRITESNALIVQLQREALTNKEALADLNIELQNNQQLYLQLEDAISHHDHLISSLQADVLKNKDLSKKLGEAIEENKRIVDRIKREISDIQELQDILVKYSNNPDGHPALHSAIKNGDKRAVKVLLKHGADVNARTAAYTKELPYHQPTSEGYTALHQAIFSDQLEIAQLLIDNGADINAFYGTTGWTSIHFAAKIGNSQMIKLLHKNGSNIDQDASDAVVLAIAISLMTI